MKNRAVNVKVSNWTDLLPIINNNVNFARFGIRKLNSKTNLLIFVGVVAAYKAYNRINKLEAEIEMLKNRGESEPTIMNNDEYSAAEFERTAAVSEGEPDVT